MTKSHLVVLTHACNNDTETPLLEYREGYNGDETTFWYPNIACMKSILQQQGFRSFDAIKVVCQLVQVLRLAWIGTHCMPFGSVPRLAQIDLHVTLCAVSTADDRD